MEDKTVLEKVWSKKKKEEILNILKNGVKDGTRHNSRKYLVHFLRFIGYSDEEIYRIIDKHNEWSDYKPERTWEQI